MSARAALGRHWPEYLIEAAGLGVFMMAAGICVVLANASAATQAIASADARRVLIGLAMGLVAIAIIYSPWGRRSSSVCTSGWSRSPAMRGWWRGAACAWIPPW